MLVLAYVVLVAHEDEHTEILHDTTGFYGLNIEKENGSSQFTTFYHVTL